MHPRRLLDLFEGVRGSSFRDWLLFLPLDSVINMFGIIRKNNLERDNLVLRVFSLYLDFFPVVSKRVGFVILHGAYRSARR